MKKIINKLVVLSVMSMTALTSSCTEWLNVSSKTNIIESELFASGDGYRLALNGVYQLMADDDLYCKELTWGFATVMTGLYTQTSVTGNMYLNEYDDYLGGLPETDDMIDDIYDPMWAAAFEVVVNCNNLLSYAENEDADFFEFGAYERDIIIGEAKAVRALMHFEMFRFFGYPIGDSGASEARLPYVTDPKTTVPNYYNSEDYLNLIIADLEEAVDLMEEYDLLASGVFSWSKFDIYLDVEEFENFVYTFMSCRGHRLNYFAAKVLLARAYMFVEDYDAAYECAETIYNYGPQGSGLISNNLFEDAKMAEEILFASYNDEMRDDYVSHLGGEDNSISIQSKDSYFGDDKDDLRYTVLFDVGTDVSVRWSMDTEFNDMLIPIIRFSEVNHIMAECMTRPTCKYYSKAGALSLLQSFIFNYRNINSDLTITYADANEETIRAVIWNDIVRETMDEGYLAWLYKRNGTGFTYHDVLPLPLAETDYTSYNDDLY